MNLSDQFTDLSIQFLSFSVSLATGADAMIERIMSNEDVFYRLQQRGAPDLTDDEKRTILSDLFKTQPCVFISRYCHYMIPSDCDCFNLNDYEIAFYSKLINDKCETEIQQSSKKVRTEFDVSYNFCVLLWITETFHCKDTVVRNRRYAEMERLKRESDYFSNAKMREREPLLFDKMVGQYLPEEEQIYLRPSVENDSLSGVFMQFEDSQIISDRRKAQLQRWNEVFEVVSILRSYEDVGEKSRRTDGACGHLAMHAAIRECNLEECSDDEKCSEHEMSDDELLEGEMHKLRVEKKQSENEIKKGETVEENQLHVEQNMEECSMSSEDENGRDVEQMRMDFVDHMEQRFLRGDDKEFFDYKLIDEEPYSKEMQKMHDRDVEDAYFDDD
ncbi:unnamed protein product [Anisakis simplex]|uniref:DUF2052 domain-containing protein n=1 Tax=Anisakis simplex TaxID=6269 RepID=A0A0M3JZZ1_ANISI|nr:unnamed protein product [Anisakis simplex]